MKQVIIVVMAAMYFMLTVSIGLFRYDHKISNDHSAKALNCKQCERYSSIKTDVKADKTELSPFFFNQLNDKQPSKAWTNYNIAQQVQDHSHHIVSDIPIYLVTRSLLI